MLGGGELFGGELVVAVDGDAERMGRLSRKLEGYTRPLTSMSKRTDKNKPASNSNQRRTLI